MQTSHGRLQHHLMITPAYWLPELSPAPSTGSVSPGMDALFVQHPRWVWCLAAAASYNYGNPVAQSDDASGSAESPAGTHAFPVAAATAAATTTKQNSSSHVAGMTGAEGLITVPPPAPHLCIRRTRRGYHGHPNTSADEHGSLWTCSLCTIWGCRGDHDGGIE